MIDINENFSKAPWYIALLRALQCVDAPSLFDPDSEKLFLVTRNGT